MDGDREMRTDQSWPDEGATSVEYALMASFIAVAISLSVAALGTTLSGLFAGAMAAF